MARLDGSAQLSSLGPLSRTNAVHGLPMAISGLFTVAFGPDRDLQPFRQLHQTPSQTVAPDTPQPKGPTTASPGVHNLSLCQMSLYTTVIQHEHVQCDTDNTVIRFDRFESILQLFGSYARVHSTSSPPIDLQYSSSIPQFHQKWLVCAWEDTLWVMFSTLFQTKPEMSSTKKKYKIPIIE